MPSIVGVYFMNKGKTPIELMGVLPDEEHPGEIGNKFEKGFTYPPVGDDYYAEMYAMAIYPGGHRQKVSGDVQTVLKVSHIPEFVDPENYIKIILEDETTLDISLFPFILDMSHVVEFEIEPECISYIQIRSRQRLTVDTWTEWVELEPVESEPYLTFADNVFTWTAGGTITLPVGSNEIQWRVFDSTVRLINDEFVDQPVASNWSETKRIIIAKQIIG